MDIIISLISGAASGGTAAVIVGNAINAHNNSGDSNNLGEKILAAEKYLGYRLIPESYITQSTSPRREVLLKTPNAPRGQIDACCGRISSPGYRSVVRTGNWHTVVIWDIDGYDVPRAYFEYNGTVYFGNAYAAYVAYGVVGV